MLLIRNLFVLLTLFFCSTVASQVDDVLQNKDVTQGALIDALSPKPDPGALERQSGAPGNAGTGGDGSFPDGRSRQFKMVREKPATIPSTRPKPLVAAARPSASLMITFESSSARLTQLSRGILDTVAKALNSERLAGYSFNIEGHADPTGIPELNVRLSEARAMAVRDYLATTHGVDAARLIAIGKGSSELLNVSNPIAPENRRVRIVNISQ